MLVVLLLILLFSYSVLNINLYFIDLYYLKSPFNKELLYDDRFLSRLRTMLGTLEYVFLGSKATVVLIIVIELI